jgi:general secretion pathway protein F
MAVYEYRGLDAAGRSINGIIDSETVKAARAKLRKTGVFPTEVHEQQMAAGSDAETMTAGLTLKKIFGRIRQQDISIMTRQLATLLTAGIPLVDSLNALTEQVENVKMKTVVSQIRQSVREGASLADAMRSSSPVFTDLYISMIRAGESSGTLDVVLLRLAEFMENQIKIMNKIKAALAYPIFMSVVMVLVVAIIVTFVIPKVSKIFHDVGKTLPIYTSILISVSDFLKSYWWVVIIVGVAAYYMMKKYLKTERGREWFDGWKLRAPIMGRLVRMVAVSRFARTLSTLLKSGVPLPLSMDIVKNVVNNVVISRAISDAKVAIMEGSSIAEPLKKSRLFPPIIIHMIAVGEKTGELESMLAKVSDSFDNEVEASVTGMTSLLEPIIILVMGGIVFFLMISILLPIFQMNQLVK